MLLANNFQCLGTIFAGLIEDMGTQTSRESAVEVRDRIDDFLPGAMKANRVAVARNKPTAKP